MKTLIFTIGILISLLSNSISNDISLNSMNVGLETSSELINSSSSSSHLVKTTHYKGEIIPMVQLLSFNVIGFVEESTQVKTVINNGERIPLVVLPELDIVAYK